MKRAAILLAGLGLSLPSLRVVAEEESCTALQAPSSLSFRDTGFDQARAACGANTMSAGARAFALVDERDFYGTLSASLFIDYRILHDSGFEFGIGARLVDYRFAQSAVFTANEFSVGPVHLDVLRPSKRTWFGQPLVLSHGFRFDVPYTNSSDGSFTLSASPSIMATMFLSPSLHWHGRVSALLWSVLPDAGADGRSALLGSTDLSYSPYSLTSLLIGTEVQGGWYGLGLDHWQVRGGMRIRAGASGAMELSAGTALAGNERADLVLWFGYRRSTAPKKQNKPSRLQDWAR